MDSGLVQLQPKFEISDEMMVQYNTIIQKLNQYRINREIKVIKNENVAKFDFWKKKQIH